MTTQPAKSEGNDKRLKSELRVYYGTSQQTVLAGFSVDLSTGGLYLQTNQPLTIDEHLTLIFSLPDQEKTITCQARVAWVNAPDDPRKPELPPGVGVQFVDLGLDAVKAIRRFLEYNQIEPKW